MFETLALLPFSFWLVIAILAGGGVWAVRHLRDGTGLPTLAVLGTAAAWYVGDAFYNDYAHNHATLFKADVLADAWWQMAWFLLVFLLAVPVFHQWFNQRFLNRSSGALQMFQHGVGQPYFQKQMIVLFYGCATIFLILCVIAVIVLRERIPYFFFPFLGYKASPWSHGRVGAGFDCFSILAVHLQMLVAGIFGVVAALSINRRIMWLALSFCLLSWPYFIFDRTRNSMLSVMVPGIISFAFLRLRGGLVKKFAFLGACFLLINAWMGFVIANRSNMSINSAFEEKGFSLTENSKVHHEGLNMFEELCWVNTFIQEGTYNPNWGSRYFAEIVNPIPRALWPGKPLIGLDYAIARGHGEEKDTTGGGVNTTISTGFIGQGVVNFGRFLGPMAAGLLMAFWVAVLARLDLEMNELGRLPLYSLGLILTFNLGRDITLITLYPFVFGLVVLWWLDRGAKAEIGKAESRNWESIRLRQATSPQGKQKVEIAKAQGGPLPVLPRMSRTRQWPLRERKWRKTIGFFNRPRASVGLRKD